MPIISKANGKASGTASVAQKKTLLSPPPIITGKANGKIQEKAAFLNIKEYISAVVALIHYLQQMSTKVAIIHFDYLALIIFLSYPMSKSQNLIGGWSWEYIYY